MTTTQTTSEALKNANSVTNQTIKGEFIGKHVFCNVGPMVEYILKQGFESSDAPFSYDDVENYYSLPEYTGTHVSFPGGSESERDHEVQMLQEEIHELDLRILELGCNENQTPEQEEIITELQNKSSELENEIQELEALESEPQEIYEWWAVSEFLYRKLKEMGHPVLDAGSCNVWGRCTTGQVILLDYAISRICAEMEILEGQANSWAK